MTPELKLAYLFGVLALVLLLPTPAMLATLAILQAALWVASAVPWRSLSRMMRRLSVFMAIVMLSYLFVSVGPSDRWITMPLWRWDVPLNLGGLAVAGVMCLRVFVLIFASVWVLESSRPGELVAALRRLHVPGFLAAAIEGTIQLTFGPGRGGMGGGGGRHRSTGHRADGEEPLRLDYAQLRQRKLGVVTEMVEAAMRRGMMRVADGSPGLDERQTHDVAIIAGLSAAIMATKALQLFPGLPFAPGHKNVVILPILLLASKLTYSRWGGLWTGVTAGTVSVMAGYGQYGVFELFHFAVPGLMADLLLPLCRTNGPLWLRLVQYGLLGAVLGLTRFSANLVMILLVGAPTMAFVLYLPMLVSQVLFGSLSGFVTLTLLDALGARRAGTADASESLSRTALVGGDGRTHVQSGLMRESLVSRQLNASTEGGAIRRMVPDVSFIAIGGQSIMDRGAEAVLPLVETIIELRKEHKLVIGVGGGARVRHTYAIGLDLGLPIGGLARVMGAVEEQNRDLLVFLLAPHGGITFIKDHLLDLPMWLDGGMIPVCIGQPPYHFWEPPPWNGRLPEHGTDVGLFLMAELIGAARLIYVKDVDGLYSDNPRTKPDATFIPEIGARKLIEMNVPDLPFDRELPRCLQNSRTLDRIHLVNGLKPESLRQVFHGERIGSMIKAGGRRLP